MSMNFFCGWARTMLWMWWASFTFQFICICLFMCYLD